MVVSSLRALILGPVFHVLAISIYRSSVLFVVFQVQFIKGKKKKNQIP